MQIDGNSYDDDKLQSIAERDTPAAVIAQLALQVGDNDSVTAGAENIHEYRAVGD